MWTITKPCHELKVKSENKMKYVKIRSNYDMPLVEIFPPQTKRGYYNAEISEPNYQPIGNKIE